MAAGKVTEIWNLLSLTLKWMLKKAMNSSSHEGEEFLYVLEGTIEVIYGQNNYVLETGDSIYYDSIVSHHVHSSMMKQQKS